MVEPNSDTWANDKERRVKTELRSTLLCDHPSTMRQIVDRFGYEWIKPSEFVLQLWKEHGILLEQICQVGDRKFLNELCNNLPYQVREPYTVFMEFVKFWTYTQKAFPNFLTEKR
jgi:hypothetical protein